jgi:hypothetical protein
MEPAESAGGSDTREKGAARKGLFSHAQTRKTRRKGKQ